MLGMPLPASASGDESVGEASEGRVLTLNGHPLWEVLQEQAVQRKNGLTS